MGNTHIVTAEARTTGILKCRGICRTTTTTTKRRCRCVCSSRRRRPRNYWHDRNPEECLRAPSVRSQTPACNLTNDNTVLLTDVFQGCPDPPLVFLLHLLPLEMTSTVWPDSTSRSFQCMEDGSLSRTLAFNCGHGYTQEEHAVKSKRERERFL